MNLHDTNTYAGEKGGANKDLIMNNAAFVRTRENMNEFNGCGTVAKAIRRGFLNLLPDQTDKRFTPRLLKLIKMINLNDVEGTRGKRSVIISASRPILMKIVFNELQNVAEMIQDEFTFSHIALRTEATLKVTDFKLKPILVPEGAGYFRLQNHLSVISDYSYSETTRCYEPVDAFNGKSTFIYSEYTPIDTPLTVELKAAFPEGSLVGNEVSILECAGLEFYQKVGKAYLPLKGSSMMMIDVF